MHKAPSCPGAGPAVRTGLPAATTNWTPAAFVGDGGAAEAGGAANFRGKG